MTDNHDDSEPIGERIIRPASGQEQPREQHIDEQFRDEWRELRARYEDDGQEQPPADPTVNVWKPGRAKSWQPSSIWPSLNIDGTETPPVTPSRQNTEPGDAEDESKKPRKRRKWTLRRVLLALVVLIVLALAGWDIGVRLSDNGTTANLSQQGSTSSAPKAGAVPAVIRKTALTYERLSVTQQGTKWCPMTADPSGCLKVFGSHQMYLGSFKTQPKVIAAAMVPTNDGSAPTNAAVFVGYQLDGHTQAQEDIFVIRLADHKIVGSDLAISADQAGEGPAQLGAAILADPSSVDGATTW